MEYKFNEMSLPTVALDAKSGHSSSQAEINGNVPLPHERIANRLLTSTGRIEVTSVEVTENRIQTEGSIMIHCICSDDELFSFDSVATFRHSFEHNGAKPHMKAVVHAELITFNTALVDNSIKLEAVADIQCRLEDNSKRQLLAQQDDIEQKSVSFEYCNLHPVGDQTVRLREEVIAQDAMRIINCEGAAIIREMQLMGESVRVDGILSVTLLSQNADLDFTQTAQNIPFAVDIALETDVVDPLVGKIDTTKIVARSMGSEFGLVSVEAQIKINLFSQSNEKKTVVVDAYNPKNPFDCEKTPVQLLLCKGMVEQKTMLRETVRVDNEDVARPMFASVRPMITGATKSQNGVMVDGVSNITVMYLDENRRAVAVTDEAPFTVELMMPYENVELDAKAICLTATVAGYTKSSIDVNYTLNVTATIFELLDTDIVTGTKPIAEQTSAPAGFVVCFADSDENTYDLAKRLNVTKKELIAGNPRLSDNIKSGEWAVVLR